MKEPTSEDRERGAELLAEAFAIGGAKLAPPPRQQTPEEQAQSEVMAALFGDAHDRNTVRQETQS